MRREEAVWKVILNEDFGVSQEVESSGRGAPAGEEQDVKPVASASFRGRWFEVVIWNMKVNLFYDSSLATRLLYQEDRVGLTGDKDRHSFPKDGSLKVWLTCEGNIFQ